MPTTVTATLPEELGRIVLAEWEWVTGVADCPVVQGRFDDLVMTEGLADHGAALRW